MGSREEAEALRLYLPCEPGGVRPHGSRCVIKNQERDGPHIDF